MKRSAGFQKNITMAAFDRKLIKSVINYHGENVAESKKQKLAFYLYYAIIILHFTAAPINNH